jgi:hypothetical protein
LRVVRINTKAVRMQPAAHKALACPACPWPHVPESSIQTVPAVWKFFGSPYHLEASRFHPCRLPEHRYHQSFRFRCVENAARGLCRKTFILPLPQRLRRFSLSSAAGQLP